jgi:Holliday junction DNA helicase RuvA
MISLLRGIIAKHAPGKATVDVRGVGYAVSVPLPLWDLLETGKEAELLTVTYVREDRLELYGFADTATRTLFESAIEMSGVGPKLGLEICSVPRHLLVTAINEKDTRLLTSIKGVGKKTAEKLLLDLENLSEKHPELFGVASGETGKSGAYDQDVIDALTSLGYDTSTVMRALKNVPPELSKEERVTAALRSL